MNKKIVMVIIAVLAIITLVSTAKSSSPASVVEDFYAEVNKGNATEAKVQYFPKADIDELTYLKGKIAKVEITDQKEGKGYEEGYGDVWINVFLKEGVKEDACARRQADPWNAPKADWYICSFKESKHLLMEKPGDVWRISGEI